MTNRINVKKNELTAEGKYTDEQISFIIRFQCGVSVALGTAITNASYEGGVTGFYAGIRLGVWSGDPLLVPVAAIVGAGAGALGTYLFLNAASDQIVDASEQFAKNILPFADIYSRDFSLSVNLTIDGDNYNNNLNGCEPSLLRIGGNDTIRGNGGDDIINGNAGNDYLYGGIGSDTYIFNPSQGGSAIITDSDKEGRVQYGGVILNSGSKTNKISNGYTGVAIYQNSGITYTWYDNYDLKVNNNVVIKDFHNGNLGKDYKTANISYKI